jgi:hypothetical protein
VKQEPEEEKPLLNMDIYKQNNDMKNKLQSIQSGKAYLEKKIMEYESRLKQMKQKKEKKV